MAAVRARRRAVVRARAEARARWRAAVTARQTAVARARWREGNVEGGGEREKLAGWCVRAAQICGGAGVRRRCRPSACASFDCPCAICAPGLRCCETGAGAPVVVRARVGGKAGAHHVERVGEEGGGGPRRRARHQPRPDRPSARGARRDARRLENGVLIHGVRSKHYGGVGHVPRDRSGVPSPERQHSGLEHNAARRREAAPQSKGMARVRVDLVDNLNAVDWSGEQLRHAARDGSRGQQRRRL